MNSVKARFKEPSTWAALAGLAALFGPYAGPYTMVVQVAAMLAGAAGVIVPETVARREP